MSRFDGPRADRLIRVSRAESGCISLSRDTDKTNKYLSLLDEPTIKNAQDVLSEIFTNGKRINSVMATGELSPDNASIALGALATKYYGVDVMIIDPIIATLGPDNLEKTSAHVRSDYKDKALCIIDYAQTQDSDILAPNVRDLMLCIAKFTPNYCGQGGTIISVETDESLKIDMLDDVREIQPAPMYV